MAENIDHKPVLNEEFNKYESWLKSTKKFMKGSLRVIKVMFGSKKYAPKNLKDLEYQPVKLGTESLSDEDRLDIEKPMQLDKMNKPLWFEINKSEFAKLTRDMDNNQDNNDFKIVIKE